MFPSIEPAWRGGAHQQHAAHWPDRERAVNALIKLENGYMSSATPITATASRSGRRIDRMADAKCGRSLPWCPTILVRNAGSPPETVARFTKEMPYILQKTVDLQTTCRHGADALVAHVGVHGTSRRTVGEGSQRQAKAVDSGSTGW
jgi:hypothetical protein